jgi:hypothetical protein
VPTNKPTPIERRWARRKSAFAHPTVVIWDIIKTNLPPPKALVERRMRAAGK